MWFVFPLNCGGQRSGGWPTEIIILFDMASQSPERHLLPFVGVYMAPKLNDTFYRSVAGFISFGRFMEQTLYTWK